MDIGYVGDPFTWTNGQAEGDKIRERLDRALCTPKWRLDYANALVFHEQCIGSDHRPLNLSLHHRRRKKSPPFRFDARWLNKEECGLIIHDNWPKDDNVATKLKRCETILKNWSREAHDKALLLESQIKLRLEELARSGRSRQAVNEEKALTIQLSKLWKDENTAWRQRSRVQWDKEGDRNTRFFHATAVYMRNRNTIKALKTDSGSWVHDEIALEGTAREFYMSLFQARHDEVNLSDFNGIPQVVPDNVNMALEAPVSDDEIKRAAFGLGANKSPGPDGFSGMFYHKHWDYIKDDLSKEIKGFFESGKMPNGWNDTHIATIPKVPNPESMSQFRPISCCNFNYKIISKIMANRLKPWIPNLVSEMQAAFTGGRMIQDNVIIVHEVLHQFKIRKKGKKCDMMIKLDMRKAYDLVDWDCLDFLLRAYGFSTSWCKWVQECIRTVRFLVLFNGAPSQPFCPTRGIRQGDPLSPFLFILMSNALSFLVERGMGNGSLHGIRLRPHCPIISHCLFADDTVIFGTATVSEVDCILSTITAYGRMTGQEVNINKSSLFFSANTPDDRRLAIKARANFVPDVCHSKYLGVPTEWGRSKKETFSYLVDRMHK
ncbi:Transposon TX1 uncharacterized 149 kDa protein [Linum grandiflorum]